MKLGVLGGTFDPLHWGHLISAEEARDILKLDKVIFIPARIPPHKQNSHISSNTHRLNMLRIVESLNPDFEVSDLEYHRAGPSYTVDTIRQIQEIYPDAQIYFLMGHDSFLELETWFQYETLLKLCQLVVVTRPGTPDVNIENFQAPIRRLFWKKVLKIDDSLTQNVDIDSTDWRICLLMIAGLRISASEVRDRVKRGRTIRYLVPEEVEKYIRNNELYITGEQNEDFDK